MACSLKTGFSVSASNEAILSSRARVTLGACPSVGALQFTDSRTKEFMGKPIDISDQKGLIDWNVKTPGYNPVKTPGCKPIKAQASICVSRAMRWWEKTLKPNMMEIHSAQDLLDSLLNAGDRLVIVDFYSPGCGGCKALHPKICQLAESNPNAIILKVNYEELKTMCHTLHIHVLPFFRFYRGAEGRLCSFSCTNATIKKFKDALAKYGADQYGMGPPKGLNESELLALASVGQLPRNLPLEQHRKDKREDLVSNGLYLSSALGKDENKIGRREGSAVVMT